MFPFNKLLVVFLIVQNTMTKPYNKWRDMIMDNDPIPWEEISSEVTTSDPKYSSQRCPDNDYSLISQSDLKYQIDDMVEKLQLEETLINNYYPQALEIFEKYSEELEEFRVELEDRPLHMLHILAEMAKQRQNLEPKVEEIVAKLQEFDIHEEYNDIAERSNTLLKQLEKYKKMCQINCADYEYYDFETRWGKEKYAVDKDMSCIKLKDLNDHLTAKLNQFLYDFDQELLDELEYRDKVYAEKIHKLKITLKEAAVKQFGITMYDILSLQDDYSHFVEYLTNINISFELNTIEENFAEIKLKLIGLKRDMEKLKLKCMHCNSNHRFIRNTFSKYVHTEEDGETVGAKYGESFEEKHYESVEGEYDVSGKDIIEELIKAKNDAIKDNINSNLTAIFEELDEGFNNPDFIDSHMTSLQPVQTDVEYAIKSEQEAFDKLRYIVRETSIEKVLAISNESYQIIQDLDSARQFIDRFLYEY